MIRPSLAATGLIGAAAARNGIRLPVLRGVVFDMDGTLTKPNLDFAEMYQRCGVPMSVDLLVAVAAMNPEAQQSATAVIDEMEEEGRRTLELLPGTVEFAQWLASHGVPTALVTRNSAKSIDHLNQALWQPAGLPPLSPAYSREDPFPAKPSPNAMFAIARSWDVPLGEGLLMVGDSPSNDISFGKAAGVATALLDTGRAHVEGNGGKPAGGGADYIVQSLAELPELLAAHYRISPVSANAPPLTKYPKPTPESAAAVAAVSGDCNVLRALPETEIDAVDAAGNSPLLWAADAGQNEAVALLLQRGADPNARGFLGATALGRACRRGSADTVRALLESEALDCLDVPNDKFQFPLHCAAFERDMECVRLMLDAGASTTVLDRKGRTPAEDTKDPVIRNAILEERARRQAAK